MRLNAPAQHTRFVALDVGGGDDDAGWMGMIVSWAGVVLFHSCTFC